jgi:outer membrane protein OmpA-like peptidoglycan-associated protein
MRGESRTLKTGFQCGAHEMRAAMFPVAIALVAGVLPVLMLFWLGNRIVSAASSLLPSASIAHAASASQQTPQVAAPSSEPKPRIDYLTLAQGAIPVRVGGSGAALGASFEKAIRAVDGDPAPFVLTLKPGTADTDVEFVYELPALTTFDRFAVPNVIETPSPSVTFAREIEVQGSAIGATEGFVVLASATLATHRTRGEITEIMPKVQKPVRWVKLRLRGGIQVMRDEMFFEFSEIIGNGTQETPARSDRFSGVWKGRGVQIRLAQDSAVVTGCYDRDGELTGTVTGNILRAIGTERSTQVQSLFILSVRDDRTLLGVRSSNRAPFAVYAGEAAPAGGPPTCAPKSRTPLGCGAVIHGITFDFDSATIRSDSEPVLAKLFEGLKDNPAGAVVIEGHTSSEGTDQYNLALSERRAHAVRADLLKRGLAASRLTAVGIGEKRPMAGNDNEHGRSLNRRVEIHCR